MGDGGAGQAIQWLLSQASSDWGGGNLSCKKMGKLERDGPEALWESWEASLQSMMRGLGRSED